MKRQIRSLHAIYNRRRARIPLGLIIIVELQVPSSSDRCGDVPDGGRLLLHVRGAGFRVVRRQGVGAGEVEGAPAVVVGSGRGGRGADVDFLRGDGAVVADLAGGDAERFLAEHVALFFEN